jgi:hypothetical protein
MNSAITNLPIAFAPASAFCLSNRSSQSLPQFCSSPSLTFSYGIIGSNLDVLLDCAIPKTVAAAAAKISLV